MGRKARIDILKEHIQVNANNGLEDNYIFHKIIMKHDVYKFRYDVR